MKRATDSFTKSMAKRKKKPASKKPRVTEREKGRIEAFHEVGLGTSEIERMTGRCAQTIRRVFHPSPPAPPKRLGPAPVLSDRDIRHIVRAAAGDESSAAKLKSDLKLSASVRTIQRTLAKVDWLEYAKMVNTLPLTAKDMLARVAWAKSMLLRKNAESVWESIIFSDEKKWNLDGPDGFQHYWRDLRLPARQTMRRQAGGGSVMAWGAFSALGKSELVLLVGRQNSDDYVYTVSENLLSFAHLNYGTGFIYQQDNASIHVL